MRGWVMGLGAAAIGALACGAIVACGSDNATNGATTNDAGGDAQGDANVITEPSACVLSPKAAPFPSGACDSPKPAQSDSFDEALSMIALDRCSLALAESDVAKGLMIALDPRRMPDFTDLHLHPLRLPAYGRETSAWLDAAVAGANPVSSAIAAAAVRRGTPITTCGDPSWSVLDGDDITPLATAIAAGASQLGAAFDIDAARLAAKSLPLDVQHALVPVVRAIAAAHADVLAARSPVKDSLFAQLKLVPSFIVGNFRIDTGADTLASLDAIDVGKMTNAAAYVASAVESAKLDAFAGRTFDPAEIDTPFGAVVIHGASNDTYMPGDKADGAALVVDLGGDDTYRVAVGAGSFAHPVSVAVDVAGKDLYGYVEKPTAADAIGHRLPSDGSPRQQGITTSRTARQGAADLGIGLLFDLAGDDTYRSLAVSQGTGVHGVGVLFDAGGNDSYKAEALSQGAAGWGIGLLLDRAGDDSYLAYNESQGFGFTKGFGALVDLAGKDTYYTDPGDPSLGGDAIYPNAQLPGPPNSTLAGNTSMSQGCGYGNRPDSPLPGFQFAGGMGVLRDAAGDDTYTTSVFGQGCAFAMGIGLFLEGGGNDVYEGLWYVQGANAHSSVALFHDAAGSDKYDPTFPIASTSIGVGHDLSVAVHFDEGGDDTYKAPNLSLGSGNANGIGVLVNVGGADVFNAGSVNSLGAANSTEIIGTSRKLVPTTGVFVKAKGQGSYVVGGADAGAYASGGSWSYAPNLGDGGGSGEKSVGIDRPNGSALLP